MNIDDVVTCAAVERGDDGTAAEVGIEGDIDRVAAAAAENGHRIESK